MSLYNCTVSSFQATAANLCGDIVSLYATQAIAGSPFFVPITSNMMFASQFYSNYTVSIVGQSHSLAHASLTDTGNTEFTDFTVPPAVESFSGSFSLCLLTTVADVYDVTVAFEGETVSQFPCFGCMTVLHDSPSIANVLIDGLDAELYTGVTYPFRVWLRDRYNNTVAKCSAYSFSFAPDPNGYISPNPTSARVPPLSRLVHSSAYYAFTLYANRTDEFSFFTYLNGAPVSSTPTTVAIIAPYPSDLSHIIPPVASTAVTDRWVNVDATKAAEA